MPEVNAMRSDLIQLIAMLEGEPALEEDMPIPMDEETAEDLGLEEWLDTDGDASGNETDGVAEGERPDLDELD